MPSVALALPIAGSCESLTSLVLPHTTITLARSVAAGTFERHAELPAFCRVAATVRPAPGSDIAFEIWMPASVWNGKFLV